MTKNHAMHLTSLLCTQSEVHNDPLSDHELGLIMSNSYLNNLSRDHPMWTLARLFYLVLLDTLFFKNI